MKKRRQLVLYGLFGGTAFTVEYLVFLILNTRLDFANSLNIAQSISFIVGLSISFFGNRLVTFNDKSANFSHKARSQALMYLSLGLTNLIITNIAIYVLVEELGILALIAKVLVMMLIVVWNFLFFQRFIFKTIQQD